MAKNTGRHSRVAQPGYIAEQPATIWTRRETSNGRFIEAKTHGGTFKGVPRSGELKLATTPWWLRLWGTLLLAIGFAETYVAATPSLIGALVGILGLSLIAIGVVAQLLRRV